MSLISVDDLEAAIPGLHFNATGDTDNQLSRVQAQDFIDQVEAEVTALAGEADVPWPLANTVGAKTLRAILLDGATSRVLSALYALSSDEETPGSVRRIADRYEAELRRLPAILRGIQADAPKTYGRAVPVFGRPKRSPHAWQDLEDFTRNADPGVPDSLRPAPRLPVEVP